MSINKTKYLLPNEFLDNLYSIYTPSEVDGILKSYNVKRNTTFRLNIIKGNEKEVIEELSENRIKVKKLNWYNEGFLIKNASEKELYKLHCFIDGKIYLQSLSSMIPPLFLDIKGGQRILDMCAAPGSKTGQIAELMRNEGYILANELNRIREERLKYNLMKLGVSCAETRLGDARELGYMYEQQFDRVMLDVPCTGEGIICISDPSTFKNWSINYVFRHSKLQKELLESGRKALKRGGIMIYSTCTISAEENEEVIHWFINKYNDMKILSITLPIYNIRQGITNYKGKVYSRDLTKALRVIPDENMEGFFVCKLLKQ